MLTTRPYPYQDSAIDRAVKNGRLLVSYEMGLGKTMVAIAAVEELLGQGEVEVALIVVPSGLKYQWAQSIAQFTDVEVRTITLKGQPITVPTERYCVVVDGTPAKRDAQYERILDNPPDYVIVSYEQVVNDWDWIRDIEPDAVVLDEATAIKTFKAQRTKKIKKLRAPYRFALTGTPCENRPEEVYSIMEWVDPEVLGRFDLFDRTYIRRNHFGGVKGYKNLDVLHKKLSAVMARKTRLDPDVAPFLPKAQHKEIYVGMRPKVQSLYNKIASELVADLQAVQVTGGFDLAAYYKGESTGDMSAQGRIMAKMLALQMLCDHPALLLDSALKFAAGEGEGSKYAFQLWEHGLIQDLTESEKFVRVVEDVEAILERNPASKVIIFSFFKEMLSLLGDRLSTYGAVTYTGDMNTAEKAAARARFQTDPDTRLFLSSDAGGYGVDLPQANYLINYDLAWSAGKMDQRNARHVRAGSAWDEVFILNYLVEGSVEERIFATLNLKRKISRAIIDGKGAGKRGRIENDIDSLTDFLVGGLE